MAIMWIRAWNKTGYVAELAVVNRLKKTGIGRKLLEALSRHMRRKKSCKA